MVKIEQSVDRISKNAISLLENQVNKLVSWERWVRLRKNSFYKQTKIKVYLPTFFG